MEIKSTKFSDRLNDILKPRMNESLTEKEVKLVRIRVILNEYMKELSERVSTDFTWSLSRCYNYCIIECKGDKPCTGNIDYMEGHDPKEFPNSDIIIKNMEEYIQYLINCENLKWK